LHRNISLEKMFQAKVVWVEGGHKRVHWFDLGWHC